MRNEVDPKTSADLRLQAALWTLVAALLFSLMNAAAKLLGASGTDLYRLQQDIPMLQITLARYVVPVLLLLPFMLARPTRLRLSSPAKYAIRTLAGFGGIALMFVAVSVIPLASATAIGFTSPIFAMVLGALCLSERVRNPQWIGAGIGLAGALIVASPGPALIAPGALIAFAAAVCMGAEIVAVKWLAQTKDGDLTVLFYSNLFGLAFAAVLATPILVWPSFPQSVVLALVGTLAVLGQGCVIRAARISTASFIAPFFYVSLFYAAAIGYVGFGEIPSLPAVIGCTVILASAAITLAFREPQSGKVFAAPPRNPMQTKAKDD